jgi:predicted DNA-binding protein YlxM (UPF0122 family)
MLYSRKEIAVMLGISRQALSQRIKARKLKPCTFDKDELKFLYNTKQVEVIKENLTPGPKPKK